MRVSSIPNSRRGLPTSLARCFLAHRPSSASLWRTKPRNGQGGQVRGHQGGLIREIPSPKSLRGAPREPTGCRGNIATEAVVRAPPDGYTLLLVNPANAISATLYDNLNFNFLRDIAPVASILRVPNVMEVNPSLPVKTVPEFIAYAKSHPGSLSFASGGIGSSVHVSGEFFKTMTGVNMVHVPNRGMPGALADLLSGQVQVVFDNLPNSMEHIRANRLRALAVTTATRWPGCAPP
jgi:tripartite-type tricarboxylate transporter receptor subunit TctC